MPDTTINALLDNYVRKRNALRSCEAAASGFVSGRTAYNLREAKKEEGGALRALAEWVEAKAREELQLPPTPVPRHLGVADASGQASRVA